MFASPLDHRNYRALTAKILQTRESGIDVPHLAQSSLRHLRWLGLPFRLAASTFRLVVLPFRLVELPFRLAELSFRLAVLPFRLVELPFRLAVCCLSAHELLNNYARFDKPTIESSVRRRSIVATRFLHSRSTTGSRARVGATCAGFIDFKLYFTFAKPSHTITEHYHLYQG